MNTKINRREMTTFAIAAGVLSTSQFGRASALFIFGPQDHTDETSRRTNMPETKTQYPPIPPDDLNRTLTFANPYHEGKLPHIGLVGDTQAKGQRSGRNVFFDIFRFEDGLVVEHWAFSAMDAPPNPSGHTQTDGPTEAKLSEDTEKNKLIVREYYETIHVSGDHSKIPHYFHGDHCIRHEPSVVDGVTAFKRDLEELTKHRSIDEIKFVLGQGDFVFIAAKGTHESNPCAYIDLYRVENGKIAERWGFPEEPPLQEDMKNNNAML